MIDLYDEQYHPEIFLRRLGWDVAVTYKAEVFVT